jgi:hypothetical protein
MTAEEARDILIHHNIWRRDNHVPNHHEMVNPTQLGIALDVAIKVLDEYIDKKVVDEEHYANYSAQLSLPF